jgi:hypothetical protein
MAPQTCKSSNSADRLADKDMLTPKEFAKAQKVSLSWLYELPRFIRKTSRGNRYCPASRILLSLTQCDGDRRPARQGGFRGPRAHHGSLI